jgi:hypothetical protein
MNTRIRLGPARGDRVRGSRRGRSAPLGAGTRLARSIARQRTRASWQERGGNASEAIDPELRDLALRGVVVGPEHDVPEDEAVAVVAIGLERSREWCQRWTGAALNT